MKYLSQVFFVLLVVALQVFFFDRMWYGVFISVYISIVILADIKIPVWAILLLGFAIGSLVDIASAGCGLNAAVTVLLAFVRYPLIKLTMPSAVVEDGGVIVVSEEIPLKNFFVYVVLAFVIWSVPFFVFESGFTSLLSILMRIVVNSVCGPIVVFLLQLLVKR